MRTTRFAALGLLLVCLVPPATAQEVEADRTLSPYFAVLTRSAASGADPLPLKSSHATIDIAGVIAKVRVEQVYANRGKEPLEAVYVFPASTRAAVHGMRMRIGDRTIEAQVRKKEQAKEAYDEARKAGKSASLLEQKRPNVFQMRVANVMPGDEIRVELDYTELLVPEGGVYELVYPAVVGPRYTGESETGERWTATPHTAEGVRATYEWGIRLQLDAGMPVGRITSPSHPLEIQRSANGAKVAIKPGAARGDRDFVFRYQLAGEAIRTGLMLYPRRDGAGGYFLLMVQPPAKLTQAAIPPREYVFVLDVSGSMRGFPLDTSKKLMRELLTGLQPTDLFNMLFFSGGNALLAPRSLPATPANVADAFARFHSMRGGGGTHLRAAMARALELPQKLDDVARTLVVVTDGYVAVDNTLFPLIRNSLHEANVFAFGIGSSVNRFVIESVARAGMGEPFVVLHDDQAEQKAQAFQRYISSPALTDVKVTPKGFTTYDVEPPHVPSLFAERPLIVFGKYRGAPAGRIRVTGRTGQGSMERVVNVSEVLPTASNEALRYLWARHRIARLSDENQLRPAGSKSEEITKLGLEHHLLTETTSFVAIDSQVRNRTGAGPTVKQPLPLPSGVSNSAVGGRSGGYISAAKRRSAGMKCPSGQYAVGGRCVARRSPSWSKPDRPGGNASATPISCRIITVFAAENGTRITLNRGKIHRVQVGDRVKVAGVGVFVVKKVFPTRSFAWSKKDLSKALASHNRCTIQRQTTKP